MKRLLLACLLCFCISWLNAQEISVKRERVFTGTGLYGYMNGGAEQFLEYGVTKLTAYDLEYGGEEYALEIYEMPTPEDAYGIYSLHVFRCQRADTLGCIDCLSTYQLQTVCGNLYVSLVFPSGTKKAKQQADDILRAIICFKTPEQLDSLRNKLPSDKILNSGSLFLEYIGDDDDNSSGDDGGFWF